ncbi:hypothetical protein MMC07_009275, partial [Pseudocyphellaria aurata]|nr:hypothetical protein [Pseudocyphellaria aurata]
TICQLSKAREDTTVAKKTAIVERDDAITARDEAILSQKGAHEERNRLQVEKERAVRASIMKEREVAVLLRVMDNLNAKVSALQAAPTFPALTVAAPAPLPSAGLHPTVPTVEAPPPAAGQQPLSAPAAIPLSISTVGAAATVDALLPAAKRPKLENPDKLTDGVNPEWTQWKVQMEGKMRQDADYYGTPEARKDFVMSRVAGKAFKHLEPR